MSAFWITLAALGLVFMVVAIGRIARAYRPDPELGGLPVTPLERLGWVGLAVTGGVAAGMAILVLVFGVEGFHGQSAARFSFWLLLLAGVGIWTVVWYWTRRDAGSLVVDERDRAVLARSFSVESMVVLVSLVAWTVGLTEAFWDEGSVPVSYLQLLFWSTFVGGAMGRSLGIVLGYRRGIALDA
jgi:hypothetical protein